MPKRGDIWFVAIESHGNEQQGDRPVLVISPDDFNNATGLVIALSITGGGRASRTKGMAVPLIGEGLRTDGVVQCEQVRTLDLNSRKARYVERAPASIVDEAAGKLMALLE